MNDALKCYLQANELVPIEPKYVTNLLYAQLEFAKRNIEEGELNLPSDWEERLEKILKKHPDFINAIRIKAQFISESQGVNVAEDFLRKSEHWDKERTSFLSLLAGLYYEKGDLDHSLVLLKEAEPLMPEHPWYFWTQYGSKCLIKALGSDEYNFRGYGPTNIDIRLLNKAYDCYKTAIRTIVLLGYPPRSAEALANYSVVCMLLGKPEESNSSCMNFLQVNPDNLTVNTSFAASLFRQGEGYKALPYIRSVYEANPNGESEYRNYALVLFYSDAFEKLLKLVQEREKAGFVDKEEEGFSRELAAVAFFELGCYDESERQLKIMQDNAELTKRAVITEAFIARKKRCTKDEILKIYREALKKFPNDEEILTKFVLELGSDSSKYAKDLKDSLEIIVTKRELMPEEYYLLGNAYMELGHPDEAIEVLTKAKNRFPFDDRFICEKANAYMKKGDDETAFKLLQEYTTKVGKKFEVLRSTAALAVNTGRLEEAIKFFQLALSKSNDMKEQGVIHCQLWHLKIKRGDSSKDILRHAVEFGRTIEDDPEAEASYLTMVMFSPKIELDESDQDVKSWIDEFRKRLEEFKKKFPKSKMFRAISFPEGLEGEELLNELLAEMFKLTAEDILGAVPFEYTSRTMPWFTTMRAKLLRESDSPFMFWNICVNSTDYSHAIHIWNGATDLDNEHSYGLEAKEVCVGLTALLTLAELNLLDLFADEFRRIYIPVNAKMVIDRSIFTPFGSHPMAEKLEDWRVKNRHRIRILHPESDIYRDDRFELSSDGLWLQSDSGIPEILEDDPNYQAMRLSIDLRAPLYSDEYLLRYWSINENNIKAFSTLSLINRLREKGRISRNQESELLSQMIKKNFRFVRFNSHHLFERLKYIISTKGGSFKHNDLKYDDVFNTFFRQFSDASLESRSLIGLATDLWLLVLKDERIARDFDEEFINEIVVSCMYLPSYSYSINKNDVEERVAVIWAVFLWRSYVERTYYFQRAWSCVKSCCERMFIQDEEKYERILFNLLPERLGKLIDTHIQDPIDKITKLFDLTSQLNYQDKEKFDVYYVQNKPSFMNHSH